MEQMQLFDMTPTEYHALWEAIVTLKESQRKMQKRLFAELGNVDERLLETQASVEMLKAKV